MSVSVVVGYENGEVVRNTFRMGRNKVLVPFMKVRNGSKAKNYDIVFNNTGIRGEIFEGLDCGKPNCDCNELQMVITRNMFENDDLCEKHRKEERRKKNRSLYQGRRL